MRSSLTPCDSSTSIALMHEPPVAESQFGQLPCKGITAKMEERHLPSMGSSKRT
jgi:hypothetical protein